MKETNQVLLDSYKDGVHAQKEIDCSLRSLKGLVGKTGQRRSFKNLKRLGTAIILAPSPEPFTDLIGLALIGAGEVGDRLKPPLTISEMSEEGASIFKDLVNSRPFTAKTFCWDLKL
jgi:hypothetical protein